MVGNVEFDDYCHELKFNCHKARRRSPGAALANQIGFLPRIIRESRIISRIVARPRMFQTAISGPADSSLTADHRIDDTGAVALAACQQARFADDAFRCVFAVSKNNIHPTSKVQFHKSLFCLYIYIIDNTGTASGAWIRNTGKEWGAVSGPRGHGLPANAVQMSKSQKAVLVPACRTGGWQARAPFQSQSL